MQLGGWCTYQFLKRSDSHCHPPYSLGRVWIGFFYFLLWSLSRNIPGYKKWPSVGYFSFKNFKHLFDFIFYTEMERGTWILLGCHIYDYALQTIYIEQQNFIRQKVPSVFSFKWTECWRDNIFDLFAYFFVLTHMIKPEFQQFWMGYMFTHLFKRLSRCQKTPVFQGVCLGYESILPARWLLKTRLLHFVFLPENQLCKCCPECWLVTWFYQDYRCWLNKYLNFSLEVDCYFSMPQIVAIFDDLLWYLSLSPFLFLSHTACLLFPHR